MTDKDIIVNGKVYPMWQQWAQKGKEFAKDYMLVEHDRDCGDAKPLAFTDITIEPNGNDSAKLVFHMENGRKYFTDLQYAYLETGYKGPAIGSTFGTTFELRRK